MIIQVEIPDFPENISKVWEPNFTLSTRIFTSAREGQTIIIRANSAGLISLAKHLLLLAQSDKKMGQNFHLDEYNSLEKGSVDLIIERID